MAKTMPRELKIMLALAAVQWDLLQADQHRRTCPQCAGRDFLEIALDVAHLLKVVYPIFNSWGYWCCDRQRLPGFS